MLNVPKADEDKWLERYQSGDESARDEMIMAFMPMAYNMVDRIVDERNKLREMKSDLKQSALEELIKAFDTFNPIKGCRFSTYANRCIRSRIFKEIRIENSYMKLKDKFTADSYQNIIDIEPSIGQFGEMDYVNVLNIIKDKLTKCELDVCMFLLENPNINNAEIGRKLNISRERVRQIRCKLKSREELGAILQNLAA